MGVVYDVIGVDRSEGEHVCFSQSSYESCAYPRSFVTAAGKWGGDVYAVSMSELVASTLILLRARRRQRVVGPSEQARLSSSPSRSGSK